MKTLEKYNSQLFVSLGSELNIERFSQYSRSMQFEELLKPRDLIYYEVKNLKGASELCRKFIRFHNLGSSSWIGGRVIDENDNFICRVSYNGRVWEKEEYPCKEIEI